MRRSLLREWPSPGLVVAIVALVAAMSGTAVGAGLEGTGLIAPDDFQKGANTRSKFRRNSVSFSRLSPRVRSLIRRGLTEPGGGGGGAPPPPTGNVPPTPPGTTGKILFAAKAGTPVQDVFVGGGVILRAACESSGQMTVTMSSYSDNTVVHVREGVAPPGERYDENDDFDVNESSGFEPFSENAQTDYTAAKGGSTEVANVSYLAEDSTFGDKPLGGLVDCLLAGHGVVR
jgi:hypothetical protein